MRAWSRPGSIGSEYLFPLYRYSESFGKVEKEPNMKGIVLNKIKESLGIDFD